MIIFYILAVIIGYFLGSVSTSYIIGRLTKGIDIRKHGSKNAGAMNAFHVLGKTAGITTLVFDLIKGALAVFVAYLLIIGPKFTLNALLGVSGFPFFFICLAGFSAVIGHVFPFYLGFRGGKGGASAGGIIILLTILLLLQRPFYLPFYLSLIVLVFFGLCIFLITGSGNLVGFVFYPLYAIILLILKQHPFSLAITFFLAYMLFISVINIVQKGGLKKDIMFAKVTKKKKSEIVFWRKALRFGAVIFPIIYFFIGKYWFIIILFIFLIVFIALDLLKLKKSKVLGKLYKKQETKVSGLTWFMIGAIIASFFFEKNLAILALVFAAIGDNAAILLGIKFGKTRIFGEKTMEGTISCLASCLLAGLIVMLFLEVSLMIVAAGAAAACFAELVSGKYDNALMAPFAAAVMMFVGLV